MISTISASGQRAQTRWPLATAFAVASLGVSACQETPEAPSEYSEAFAQQARNEFQRAQDAGASADQLAILERAATAGNMTFADAEEAVRNTFTCWDRAGVPHSTLDNAGSSGFPELYYAFGSVPGLSEAESLAIADACLNSESFFVERLYSSSPGFVDNLAAAFEPNAQSFAECTTEAGVALDSDVTYQEAIAVLDSAQAEGIDISACYRFLP